MTRAILITGCSSGIGLDAAERLKARGYRVFPTARKDEDLAMLENKGFEPIYIEMDDSATIQTAAETVLSKTEGKLYGLFNNAGFGQPGAVEDLKRDVIRAQFETNVFGLLELTNLIIPAMRKQGEGRIIQNSSVLGYTPLAYRGAYNASKYALEGLSDTLRIELLKSNSGVYVSVVAPGPITSKFRQHAHEKFIANIDYQHSAHAEYYEKVLARLENLTARTRFTLEPVAVTEKVIKALESKRPKPRYYVTFPTYLFMVLKRVLTTDAFLSVVGRHA